MAAKKTAKPAPARRYERASGTGLEIELVFKNRLLMQTFAYSFERTDNQLQALSLWRGAGADVEKIRLLMEEQILALDTAIEQLQGLAAQASVKPSYAGQGFRVKAIALTPYSVRFVEILKRIDVAISWLYALWVAGQIEDQTFREQAQKLRSRAHRSSAAVGEVYRRHVLKIPDSGSETAGQGQAEPGQEGQESAGPLAEMEAEMDAEMQAEMDAENAAA